MNIQNYVINKDYAFNLTDRAKNKRITSQHGIVKCLLSLSYHCRQDFSRAWESIKNAGWNVNYKKTEIELIFNDLSENAFFINKEDVNSKLHIVAVL